MYVKRTMFFMDPFTFVLLETSNIYIIVCVV